MCVSCVLPQMASPSQVRINFIPEFKKVTIVTPNEELSSPTDDTNTKSNDSLPKESSIIRHRMGTNSLQLLDEKEKSKGILPDEGPTASRKNYLQPPVDVYFPKEIKRSFSFSGFGLFCPRNFVLSSRFSDEMTRQELESMVDPVTKREPSKISKQKIKEYGLKYKHLKGNTNKEKLPWYKEAIEYTQPAHMITIIAFLYLAFRLFPDSRRSAAEASTLTRLLYVSSVSAVFGTQFWMTFISGLALFFTVPRHVFAQVQTVLFPLYFLTNAALMLVSVVTYTQHHPTHLWDTHQLIQGAMLVFGFIVNLGIRLYLAPILTKLITIKMAIESEVGLGNEVGTNQPGTVLSQCPHYMRLYRAFRKTHMVIAIGNMASITATSFHLYYLATKLCSMYLK